MSKTIAFIGDIHGKIAEYQKITEEFNSRGVPTVQVGDFGVGFVDVAPDFGPLNRFIRGNHDSPALAKSHANCIEDGTIEDGKMFIGGAFSPDMQWRIPGRSWWHDEQLSDREFDGLEDIYADYTPSVMITHDCPYQIVSRLGGNPEWTSKTRDRLGDFLRIHAPKLWIFGHWHKSFDQTIFGTRFICLNELEAKEIDMEQYK